MFGAEPGDAGRPWFSEPCPVVRVAAGVELVVLPVDHAEGGPDQLPLVGDVRPAEQLAAEEVGGHGVATKSEVSFRHQAARPRVCSPVLHSPDQALQGRLLEALEHRRGHISSILLSLALLVIPALQLPELLHQVRPPASEHEHVCWGGRSWRVVRAFFAPPTMNLTEHTVLPPYPATKLVTEVFFTL